MNFNLRCLFCLHIFFWILVAFGIIALIKCIMRPGQKKKDQALELLRKSYAKGEISRQEFEEKKKDLLKA